MELKETILIPMPRNEFQDLLAETVTACLNRMIKKSPETLTPRRVLNIDQACEIVHLSKSRLYVLAGEGSIPNFKKGNKLLFYEDELFKWVESGKQQSKDEINQAADEALLKETA